MRIRIPHPSLCEELGAHYARAGFAVRTVSELELDVERLDAPDEAQGRREAAAHLLVWELIHPDSPGEILD